METGNLGILHTLQLNKLVLVVKIIIHSAASPL